VSHSPFSHDVPDAVLADLHARLDRTRFAAPTAQPWQAGTDPGYLRSLVHAWRHDFDWRAQEAALNAVPQFVAEVEGQRVHLVVVRGERAAGAAAPLPLLLTPGWPSAFTEMLPLVPLLTRPAEHGGRAEDAFDVVVASLPGTLFSDLPAAGPLTRPRIADLWATVMTDVLGYRRFGVYGGDIGADVGHWLAARHPDLVAGLHLIHPRMPSVTPPQDGLSPAERAYLAARDREDEEDGGYSHLQSTRPDTLAAALLDSPAGLAAWIVDKLRAWSDCNGDLSTRFSTDQILTLVTLYWVTGTIGTSFRSYYDYPSNPPRPPVAVPVGVTVSAEDDGHPRELAERVYGDIRLWHEPGKGGHFFPAEEPAILAADLRSFFAGLRDA
jgi:pimeloyl-ACP methyl ester carboxylesterase